MQSLVAGVMDEFHFAAPVCMSNGIVMTYAFFISKWLATVGAGSVLFLSHFCLFSLCRGPFRGTLFLRNGAKTGKTGDRRENRGKPGKPGKPGTGKTGDRKL